jgi:hypothetical protein
VVLVPQWRQDYPNNRPPTRATAISEMGHELPNAPQKKDCDIPLPGGPKIDVEFPDSWTCRSPAMERFRARSIRDTGHPSARTGDGVTRLELPAARRRDT